MIVIGDIHGNFKTFLGLLSIIPKSELKKGIVLVGDIVDKGPNSMQVVQYCMDNNIKSVMGNHEKLMLDWNKNRNFNDTRWLGEGGLETLDSYKKINNCDDLENNIQWDLFKKHCDYIAKLPIYLPFPNIKNSDGRYLVVSHSNINNVWQYKDSVDDMDRSRFEDFALWYRSRKIIDIPDIYNVVGHTPKQFGPHIRNVYSNIDTGCFYNGKVGYYKLTALQFPEMIIYQHDNIDIKSIKKPQISVLTLEELKKQQKSQHIKQKMRVF